MQNYWGKMFTLSHSSHKTKSFQLLGQEATLVCPLFLGIECSVCPGQGFICRAVTGLRKRSNEIMLKYCMCLCQSAYKEGSLSYPKGYSPLLLVS